jgi:hypothetical protein
LEGQHLMNPSSASHQAGSTVYTLVSTASQ